MDKKVIRLYDVIGDADLPEVLMDQVPSSGDKIEIKGEVYYVCEMLEKTNTRTAIGVIPLVVRNPASVSDIRKYIDCLSIAHRKVLFRNREGITDLDHSEEMMII
ncbi:MAG TPA: hypothetical protein VHO46_03185 [Bacteroidales bacterium]|nr:hypothetical protein [Bacteroidales bacterium]